MVRGETPNSNTGVTKTKASSQILPKNPPKLYIPLFDGILCLSAAVFRVDFLKSKTRI